MGVGPLQPGHDPSSSSRSSGVFDWSWSEGVGVTPVWSLESCVGGVADLLPVLPLHYFLPRILPPAALPAAQVLDLPGGPQEVAPAWAHNGLRGLVCICVCIKFICLFLLLAVLGLGLRFVGLLWLRTAGAAVTAVHRLSLGGFSQVENRLWACELSGCSLWALEPGSCCFWA